MTPPQMYQDPLESWTEKANRKFRENPWVPIGCLLTTGALVMSAIKMRQGQSKTMNYWLRARVALQGVTIVALVGGSMSIQNARKERLAREAALESAAAEGTSVIGGLPNDAVVIGPDGKPYHLTGEQQRQREVEKREFAERMRAAEEVTEREREVGLGGGVRSVRGPAVKEREREGK